MLATQAWVNATIKKQSGTITTPDGEEFTVWRSRVRGEVPSEYEDVDDGITVTGKWHHSLSYIQEPYGVKVVLFAKCAEGKPTFKKLQDTIRSIVVPCDNLPEGNYIIGSNTIKSTTTLPRQTPKIYEASLTLVTVVPEVPADHSPPPKAPHLDLWVGPNVEEGTTFVGSFVLTGFIPEATLTED